MTIADLPGQKYQVRVVEVSPVIDPASSTIEVAGGTRRQGGPAAVPAWMRASASKICDEHHSGSQRCAAGACQHEWSASAIPACIRRSYSRSTSKRASLVIRAFVPGVDTMYTFPPETWRLIQFFDGQRSYAEVAELYSMGIRRGVLGRNSARFQCRSRCPELLVQDGAGKKHEAHAEDRRRKAAAAEKEE